MRRTLTLCLGCLIETPPCLSDSHGNEYDLTHLTRNGDDSPWIAMDSSAAKPPSFYINVCKPLPPMKGCPGWCGS